MSFITLRHRFLRMHMDTFNPLPYFSISHTILPFLLSLENFISSYVCASKIGSRIILTKPDTYFLYVLPCLMHPHISILHLILYLHTIL
jgi:hypothetical protein